MVSQVPIDPMPLIDLGVTRKVLNLIVLGQTAGHRTNIQKISTNLLMLKEIVLSEFQRKPRSFDEIHFWKATEFRMFLLYTGIVSMKGVVSEDIYYHFLLLQCAVRILSCPHKCETLLEIADSMLKDYVENFALLYGENKLSYNVHNLLHLAACVKQFSPLDSFSAYKYENYMQLIKKNRKPSQVLQQLNNRINEINQVNLKQSNGFSPKTVSLFDEFILTPNSPGDSYCLTKDEVPLRIEEIYVENVIEYVRGFRCLNASSFFTTPIDS